MAEYTLAYTGDQIDKAIGNALQVSNPNLLDNSVFLPGCLVDQREGYVVPPGTQAYSDSGLTTATTLTGGYRTVIARTSTYTACRTAGGNMEYVAPGSEVRGYTGAGYGIDRWKQQAGIVSTIVDGAIRLICVASTGRLFEEVIDGVTPGSTVTMSILVISVSGNSSMAYIVNHATNSVLKSIKLNSTGLFTATITIPSGCNTLSVRFNPTVVGETIDVRAAKLELGTKQTLAHLENGVWVLNELPKYADTLARCQRYLRVALDSAWGDVNIPARLNATKTKLLTGIDFRTYPMRTTPALISQGIGNLRVTGVNTSGAQHVVSINITNISILSAASCPFYAEIQAPSDGLSIFDPTRSITIDLLESSNCKLLLSAEL